MNSLADELKQAYLDGELTNAVAALQQTSLRFDEKAYLIAPEVTQECHTLIVLAHGAGANMQHVFMDDLAAGLATENTRVVRFNFPYMRANALDGKRRPPDRAPKLIADYALQLSILKQHFNPAKVYLVGKSMGGRMSVMMAESVSVDGVVCLGYPFIPLKGGEPRLEPIERCQAPLMIIQGERDKFGHKGLVETWPVMSSVPLHWLTDGDHGFKPRQSSGTSLAANIAQAVSHIKTFIQEH